MARVKLTLEYDGTDYVGWQVQPNGISVQARVETALSELLGQPMRVFAAARTDSGVHALGQVVAFDTDRVLPAKAYWKGLTGLLPKDIAVVAAEEVDPRFDPRRHSGGKRYRYRVSNRPSRSPLRRRSHWEVFQPLSIGPMQEGARALLGRHDFTSFRAADCQARHAVRELSLLEWSGTPGDELSLVVEGTAFLKHMVRNLVGTLVEVGRGKRPPSWVGQVLEAKDRGQAGVTAPPHGLTLVEIFYGRGELNPDEEGGEG